MLCSLVKTNNVVIHYFPFLHCYLHISSLILQTKMEMDPDYTLPLSHSTVLSAYTKMDLPEYLKEKKNLRSK